MENNRQMIPIKFVFDKFNYAFPFTSKTWFCTHFAEGSVGRYSSNVHCVYSKLNGCEINL